MIEEETRTSIELSDRVHLFPCQLKIKYVEVLGHSVLSHRFWNDDDLPLRQPSEDDLCDRLAVLLPDRNEHFVVEDIVLSLCEWSPGLDLYVVFREEFLSLHLLVER